MGRSNGRRRTGETIMEKFEGTNNQKREALLAIKDGETLRVDFERPLEENMKLIFTADINVRDGSICVRIDEWNDRRQKWELVGYMEPSTAAKIYM